MGAVTECNCSVTAPVLQPQLFEKNLNYVMICHRKTGQYLVLYSWGDSMKSNFAFLNDTFPVLANFGSLAEEYCYSDSNSCLIKLGMIGETIVNLIYSYDRISLPWDNTAVNRIDVLLKEGLITRDLSDIQ